VTLKGKLESRIRGWFPQEPSCTNTVAAQIGQKASHRKITGYITLFVCVFAAVFLSLSAAYGLGLDSIAGAVAATVGIITAIAVNLKFKSPNQKISLTEEGRKTLRATAGANVGIVCVFLATWFLVNPNIKSAELTLGLWVVLVFSMFFVNSLLYRRLKKQMTPLEGLR
jgi:Kef-type K+ transport system membrane component KefB